MQTLVVDICSCLQEGEEVLVLSVSGALQELLVHLRLRHRPPLRFFFRHSSAAVPLERGVGISPTG